MAGTILAWHMRFGYGRYDVSVICTFRCGIYDLGVAGTIWE